MKKTLQYHSDAPTNRNALYPGACNSPLRHKAIADDSFDESDAEDSFDESDADCDTDSEEG